jgi:hypothetical protein
VKPLESGKNPVNSLVYLAVVHKRLEKKTKIFDFLCEFD